MLDQSMYSIFDRKTSLWMPPFTGVADGAVCRDIRMRMRQGLMAEFPEDFDLYEVAYWNDKTGEVKTQVPPRFVCRIDSLLGDGKRVESDD